MAEKEPHKTIRPVGVDLRLRLAYRNFTAAAEAKQKYDGASRLRRLFMNGDQIEAELHVAQQQFGRAIPEPVFTESKGFLGLGGKRTMACAGAVGKPFAFLGENAMRLVYQEAPEKKE